MADDDSPRTGGRWVLLATVLLLAVAVTIALVAYRSFGSA